MALKCKIETIFSVEERDLNQFIKEEIGKDFSVSADLESGNDSVHRIIITNEVQKWEKEEYIKFKAGNISYYMTGTIMRNLCAEGKLEAGTYIIGVFW